MQVPCSMDTEVSAESVVWQATAAFGRVTERPCQATRMSNTGGASKARPYSHPNIHSAEGIGIESDRFFIKGKSAIAIARTYVGRRKNFAGQSFWARGYYVSTVGADEESVRAYIQNQSEEDKRLDQLNLL